MTTHTLEHGGKLYELTPLDEPMIADFEKWLEDQAWQKVRNVRARCTQEEYDHNLGILFKLLAAGDFKFGSQAAARAAQSQDGQRQLLFLQLERKHGPEEAEAVAAAVFRARLKEIQARAAVTAQAAVAAQQAGAQPAG